MSALTVERLAALLRECPDLPAATWSDPQSWRPVAAWLLPRLGVSPVAAEPTAAMIAAARDVDAALRDIFAKADDDRDEAEELRVYANLRDAHARLRAALAAARGEARAPAAE